MQDSQVQLQSHRKLKDHAHQKAPNDVSQEQQFLRGQQNKYQSMKLVNRQLKNERAASEQDLDLDNGSSLGHIRMTGGKNNRRTRNYSVDYDRGKKKNEQVGESGKSPHLSTHRNKRANGGDFAGQHDQNEDLLYLDERKEQDQRKSYFESSTFLQLQQKLIKRVFSLKMKILILFLQLIIALPIIEYQYNVVENFHEIYKLDPWSFGMYGQQSSKKLLDVYEAIEVIKFDHEKGFAYNMTYYAETPHIQALLEEYLEIQHGLRNKTSLGLQVDMSLIKKDSKVDQLNDSDTNSLQDTNQPLYNTQQDTKQKQMVENQEDSKIIEDFESKKQSKKKESSKDQKVEAEVRFPGEMLSKAVFEHVLTPDYNYIHDFKNHSTLVGITSVHTLLALLASIFCLLLFIIRCKSCSKLLNNFLPYASLLCFSAMHNFLITNYKIEPFNHYIEVAHTGFFCILILLVLRTPLQAFFLLLHEFVFGTLLHKFVYLFAVGDPSQYDPVIMSGGPEPLEQSRFYFLKIDQICLFIMAFFIVVLVFIGATVLIKLVTLVIAKFTFEDAEHKREREVNTELSEVLEIVSKPLLVFQKIENIDAQKKEYNQIIRTLLQSNPQRPVSVNSEFSSQFQTTHGSQNEYENKHYYQEIFVSLQFKEMIAKTVQSSNQGVGSANIDVESLFSAKGTNSRQLTSMLQKRQEDFSQDLENQEKSWEQIEQNQPLLTEEGLLDFGLLCDNKILKKIVFKEIIFNLKQESNISEFTQSQYSKSKASSKEIEQNIDRVNGAHYTIEQLIQRSDLESYQNQVFQLLIDAELKNQKQSGSIKRLQSDEVLYQKSDKQHFEECAKNILSKSSEVQKIEKQMQSDLEMVQQNCSSESSDIENPIQKSLKFNEQSQNIASITVRVKVQEFKKFGKIYRILKLQKCDLAKEIRQIQKKIQIPREPDQFDSNNEGSEQLLNDNINVEKENLIMSTESLKKQQTQQSLMQRIKAGPGNIHKKQLSKVQNSQQSLTVMQMRLVKTANLMARMIPEQQTIINTLINYSEGVVFNIKNSQKFIYICTLALKKILARGERPAQGLSNFALKSNQSEDLSILQRSFFQMTQKINEIERDTNMIWQTSKILAQQIEVESLYTKMAKNTLDLRFQKIQHGSYRVFKEVLGTFRELINDKNLTILVDDQTSKQIEQLQFDWNLYKSMFYLLIQSAIPESLRGRPLLITSKIYTQRDGILVKREEYDIRNSKEDNEDDIYSDSVSNSEQFEEETKSYLVTKIFVMESTLGEDQTVKAIRKGNNFRMAKDFSRIFNGEAIVSQDDKIAIFQTILPLSKKVYEQQLVIIDRNNSNSLVQKPQFLQKLVAETKEDIKQENFFQTFRKFKIQEQFDTENDTTSDITTQNFFPLGGNQSFDEIDGLGSTNRKSSNLSKSDKSNKSDKYSKNRQNRKFSGSQKKSKDKKQSILAFNSLSGVDEEDSMKEASFVQQSENQESEQDSYQISMSESQFGTVDEGPDLNQYVKYDNNDHVKHSSYIKSMGLPDRDNVPPSEEELRTFALLPNASLCMSTSQQSQKSGQQPEQSTTPPSNEMIGLASKLQEKSKVNSQQADNSGLENNDKEDFQTRFNLHAVEPKELDLLRKLVAKDYSKNLQNSIAKFVPSKAMRQKRMRNMIDQIIVEENDYEELGILNFAPQMTKGDDKKQSDQYVPRNSYVDRLALEKAALDEASRKDEKQNSEKKPHQNQAMKSAKKRTVNSSDSDKNYKRKQNKKDKQSSKSTFSDLETVKKAKLERQKTLRQGSKNHFDVDSSQFSDIKSQNSYFSQSDSNNDSFLQSASNNQNQDMSFEIASGQNKSKMIRKITIEDNDSISRPSEQNSLYENFSSKEPEQQSKDYKKKVLVNSKVSSQSCGCTATVLIVEDNFYNVVPLKMMLRQSFGIQIMRAENGKIGVDMYVEDAIKTCCQKKFMLIFMDIQMPVLNGYEATIEILKQFELLSKQPQHSDLQKPVIFAMTAFSNQQTLSECVSAGMNGILYKPINRRGLIQQIDKLFIRCEQPGQEVKLKRKMP